MIDKVAIVGSGLMGAGIAQVAAQAGLQVLLYDLHTTALDKAINNINANFEKAVSIGKMTEEEADAARAKMVYSNQIGDVVAPLIIEAIVERLPAKVELFKILASQNQNNTILATNTSSISITAIAAQVPHPERVVGFHFFNPAHIMKLVEIIAGEATDLAYVEALEKLSIQFNKVPVRAKDAPGFIVNRVARSFYTEALKLVEDGVATFDTIDACMEASGFKMGPFRLMDLIGIDTNFAVTSSMYEQFFYEPRFRPSRIQQQKVLAGHWGRKTKKGIYDY